MSAVSDRNKAAAAELHYLASLVEKGEVLVDLQYECEPVVKTAMASGVIFEAGIYRSIEKTEIWRVTALRVSNTLYVKSWVPK